MNWYLRKPEGEVYGPVDLATLQLWATDNRVSSDDFVSQDRENWRRATDMPELGLDWVIEMRDGSEFGPVHALVVRDLVHEGSVSRRAFMTNVRTGEKVIVSEGLVAIFSGLSQYIQGVASAGRLMSEPSEAASPTREGDPLAAEARRLSEQCAKLEAEVEHWKRQYEESARAAEARESDLKARSSEARASDARIEGLRVELEQARRTLEEERAVALKREADLKAQLREAKSQLQSVQELRQQVEKWKSLYEQAKEATRVGATAAVVESSGDMVPRARLEEVERRLAQVQRNYQQLARALNRSLASDTGHVSTTDRLRNSQMK